MSPLGPAERRRRRNYFRATGLSGRPDNAALKRHLEKLAGHISIAEIARRSGVPEGTIWYQLNCEPTSCYVPTLQRLAKVRLAQSDLEKLSHEEHMWGAYRIVQGLAALGWTGDAISAATGLTVHVIRTMGRTPRPAYLNQTGPNTYQALLLGAQKLERLHPVRDGGVPERVYKSTKARARTRGSAPLGCWDMDTVHDPSVQPEWTGLCGTVEGYRIHRREKIPICPACRAADNNRPPVSGSFSPRKFRQARREAGYSQRQLEKVLGFADGAISHWENGRSVPRTRNLASAMDALGVKLDDVSEEV